MCLGRGVEERAMMVGGVVGNNVGLVGREVGWGASWWWRWGVVGPPGRGGVGGTLGGHHPHSGGRASVRARPSEGNHRSCGGSVRSKIKSFHLIFRILNSDNYPKNNILESEIFLKCFMTDLSALEKFLDFSPKQFTHIF